MLPANSMAFNNTYRYTRVLDHPELLQLILQHLDVHTLLVSAQRVSRQWRHIISTSIKLQEALFLRPVQLRKVTGRIKPVQNSLVLRRGWMLQMLFTISNDDLDDLLKAGTRGLPYPVHVPSSPSSVVPLRHVLHEIEGSLYSNRAFSRPGASWRRLLIQQPPITTFGQILCRRDVDGSYKTHMGMVEYTKGIRLGHIWDSLRQSLGHFEASSCYVRLVWWEPSATLFDTEQWPMADEMVRLFMEGAQLVLLIGYTYEEEACFSGHGMEDRRRANHDVLNRCEEYEPLDFNMKPQPRFRMSATGRRVPA